MNNNKESGLIKRVMGLLLGTVLVLLLLVAGINYSASKTQLTKLTYDNLAAASLRIAESLDNVFTSNAKVSEAAATSTVFIDFLEAVQDRKNFKTTAGYDKVVKNLVGIRSLDSSISAVYIGSDRADTIVTDEGWVGEEGKFSLAQRPWYKGSLGNNGVSFSDVYIDAITGKMCVTVSTLIRDKSGNKIGAFGMDILIDQLPAIINKYQIDNGGYAFLIDKIGLVLYHQETEKILNENMALLTDSAGGIGKRMLIEENGIAEYSYNGSDKLIAFATIESVNWHIGVTMPRSIVFEKVNQTTLTLASVNIIGFLLIGLVIWLVLSRPFTRLAASEYNFRNLFEGSADAIIIFKDHGIIDCNQAATKLFGTGAKDAIIGKMIWDISPERQSDGQLSQTKAVDLIQSCIKNTKIRFEWTYLKYDGSIIWVEVVLTTIILNGEKVFHALIRDMSERKIMEEKLEHMSYYDQLTGVYNRHFFEEELKRLDTRRNLPLTIMMGDVNGLKLVNDSFGHAIGDQLLMKVAELIKSSCREDDIISRVGGDEFIVLFPKTNGADAELIEKRIQFLAADKNVESLDISISFGWATKVTEEEDVKQILKKAEDYLYKKKLFESPSMRGKTIHTIIQTLHEKNKREEAHSNRVSMLCENMGMAMGLPESKIKELKNVGLLHDIGKIVIEEQMLNKPSKLTKEEWDEMARHPEIGYRILSTVNEMSEMAEYVLAHHERWDGKGYPKGLKAEEIPLEARIITLADAFDAMTSDRPYGKALSIDTSIEELRHHSGTQFDPQLVPVFIEMISKRERG